MYTILLRPQKHTVKNQTPYFCLFLSGHWTWSVILYGIRFVITLKIISFTALSLSLENIQVAGEHRGDAWYTKSIYALLSRSIVWSLLCYCVRARDHCCVLFDATWDLLLTWHIVHQPNTIRRVWTTCFMMEF